MPRPAANIPPARPIRVLLAEDHPLFAKTLAILLDTDERIEVVGRASNGAQAVELAVQLRPDVVLMDLQMPVMDGIEATRRIREALGDSRVLVLTGSGASEELERALAAGADGCIEKGRVLDGLAVAIVEVAPRPSRLQECKEP